MNKIRKRLGIVTINDQFTDKQSLLDSLSWFRPIGRVNETEYYLAEHEDFALLTFPSFIPFYTVFHPPFELKGAFSKEPFHVLWSSKDGGTEIFVTIPEEEE